MEAAICVAAAFFADRAWLPELPGLPRLRTFQRRQLQATLSWRFDGSVWKRRPGWQRWAEAADAR